MHEELIALQAAVDEADLRLQKADLAWWASAYRDEAAADAVERAMLWYVECGRTLGQWNRAHGCRVQVFQETREADLEDGNRVTGSGASRPGALPADADRGLPGGDADALPAAGGDEHPMGVG